MKNFIQIIISLSPLLFYQSSYAQSTFVKIAGSNNNAIEVIASSLTSDSGIVEVGYDYYNNTNLIKFNRFGMIEWAQYIPTGNYSTLNRVTQFRQALYACGAIDTSAYLISFNVSGQKLWSKIFNYPSSLSSSFTGIVTDSNFLYVSGTAFLPVQGNTPFLMKIDSSGSIQWCKQFNSVCITKDIIYNGHLNEIHLIGNTNFGSKIIAIDTSGNILWSKYYPSIILEKAAIQHDSEYVIIANDPLITTAIVLSISHNGNMIWVKKYTDTTFSSTKLSSIYITPTHEIYIGNTSSDPGVNPPMAILKLNENGDFIWGNSYWGFTYHVNGISGIFPNYDNGLWLTGQGPQYFDSAFLISRDSTSFTGCEANLVHVLDTLFVQQDSVISMTNQTINLTMVNPQDSLLPLLLNQNFNCPTNILNTIESDEITFFPNPSNGTFSLDGIFSEKTTFEIFDIFGKKVFEEAVPTGNYTFPVSVNLTGGIYLCRLISDKQTLHSERMVIVK